MSAEFDWWRNALKGVRGEISADDPMPGYYRQKRRDGSMEPVAYWLDSATGELRCHVNGRQPDELRMREIWPHASIRPVTEEAYWARMDLGEWPDVDAGASQAAKGPTIDPATDPVASLKAEIETAASGLDAYSKIESDESSARAQTLRSTLTSLSNKADKARETEKAPHLAAGRVVDAKWQPLVKDAAAKAYQIRDAISEWETFKRQQAKKAQDTTDNIARDYAEARRKAKEANQPPPPPPDVAKPNVPAPLSKIKGGSGRTASVTVANIIIDIDIDKCFAKFRDAPELRELFMAMADKAVKAGLCSWGEVGAKTEERAVVR